MSDKRTLMDEQLNELTANLDGTCNSLSLFLDDNFGIDEDELTAGDHTDIDGAIFQCTECGWWCPQEENVAEDGEEWICRDCKGE